MLRFVAASLLLHLLAGGLWLHGQPPAHAPVPRVLAIQLQPAGQPAVPARAAPPDSPASRPAPARHSPPAPHAAPAPVTATAAAPQRDSATAPATAVMAAAAAPPQQASEARVRAAVDAAFRARFHYPRRARLRGWEGTVVIALRLLPDGGISDVRVADSSGITVLDRAAMQALQTLRVPQAVAWMAGREMDMLIPVVYRLTDS